tara:strand:- start:100 stop:279 length:180 start_codon:yes stop_codon:yes gene_type:complete
MPGKGKLKKVKKKSKNIVDEPSIIVLPILKKVDDTMVGTIRSIAKGLNIPPVKNNSILN